MNRVQSDIVSVIKNKELYLWLKDSSIFVTGATGLVGSMLLKTLIAADDLYNLNLTLIGKIRNFEKAKKVFGELTDKIKFTEKYDVEFDYIVHTAAPTASKYFISNPVETIKTSVFGTEEALNAAKKNKAVFLYLSSMEQYGVPYEYGQIMTEDKVGIIDHLNIRSSYSESKRLCECLCMSYVSEYNVDSRIVRLAQTFGAGVSLEDNRMPMQFARSVINKKDIVLRTEGKSVSNFVYLSDAVKAILVIMKKGMSGNAYNVCNDKETRTVKEIAELVATQVADNEINFIIDIPKENLGYAPDVSMRLCTDKLCDLGWHAEVDMKEAYKRLIEYIRENG